MFVNNMSPEDIAKLVDEMLEKATSRDFVEKVIDNQPPPEAMNFMDTTAMAWITTALFALAVSGNVETMKGAEFLAMLTKAVWWQGYKSCQSKQLKEATIAE